jgi:hemoglobin
MGDIKSREDIQKLVDSFYQKVRLNEVIGPIFNEVANVDWEHHLPKMYDFWSSILLNDHSYSGQPMPKHVALSKLTSMTKAEFLEWLRLFYETVDEHYKGEVADLAKYRGRSIAGIMLHKIESQEEVQNGVS